MDGKRFGAFQNSNAFSLGDCCSIYMITPYEIYGTLKDLQIKCIDLQSLLIILTTLLIWQVRITVDKTAVKYTNSNNSVNSRERCPFEFIEWLMGNSA